MKEFIEANESMVRVIFTVFALLLYPLTRYILSKLLNRSLKTTSISLTKLVFIKRSISFILIVVVLSIVFAIWGVAPDRIFLAMSSVFAVIGVALFAQWSVLSNITAGFIIFLSMGVRIGDKIKVLDKDFPMVAKVEDIRTFYMYLRTEEGERLVYPNNLMLQKGISIVSVQ